MGECLKCSIGFLKCLIITLNAFMFCGGICMAAIAGYTAFNQNSILHQLISKADIPGAMTGLYVLLAVGILMGFVSLLGCIGALNENRLLLWLNLFFVLLLFIIDMVAVILCLYKYKSIEKQITHAIKQSANLSKSGTKTTGTLGLLRNVISVIEEEKKCCGLHGYVDYGDHIPSSCYPSIKNTQKSSGNQYDITSEDDDAGDDTEFPSSVSTSTVATTTTMEPIERPPAEERSSTIEPTTESLTQSVITTAVSTIFATEEESTTALEHTVEETTMEATTLQSTIPNAGRPYQKGCITLLSPVIYAAGGIGIAVLLLELLLVIFIGILLCQIGKEYESLA